MILIVFGNNLINDQSDGSDQFSRAESIPEDPVPSMKWVVVAEDILVATMGWVDYPGLFWWYWCNLIFIYN